METILPYIFEYQAIIMLLAGGCFGPAAFSILIKILSLPVVVDVVHVSCYAGGKWWSIFLLKIAPKYAEAMEASVEKFVLKDVLAYFFKGAKSDNRVKKLERVA
jgi:hypothetical protein